MNALILVDIQNDFLPGGALAIKQGDKILPIVNKLLEYPFDFIIATKDYHPQDHCSFAAVHHRKVGETIVLNGREQHLWPVHCVQGTQGAEFSSQLLVGKIGRTFYKGTDKAVDSYSTFFDNGHIKSTEMDAYLREKRVTDIYMAGLATDYCVKYSALDALGLGFRVFVIVDACCGIDLKKTDSAEALEEISKAGAILVHSEEILKKIKNRGGGI